MEAAVRLDVLAAVLMSPKKWVRWSSTGFCCPVPATLPSELGELETNFLSVPKILIPMTYAFCVPV